jgi:hypothetical protein
MELLLCTFSGVSLSISNFFTIAPEHSHIHLKSFFQLFWCRNCPKLSWSQTVNSWIITYLLVAFPGYRVVTL